MKELRHYLLNYNEKRTTYFKHNKNNNTNLKLEADKTLVYNEKCLEIIKPFHELRYKLNPEKYNNTNILYYDLNNIKLVRFCYYVSNLLVCISHDVVYAIKKEINKLSNYNDDSDENTTLSFIFNTFYMNNKNTNNSSNCNDEQKKAEVSQNIYKIITQSFDGIMDALMSLKSGMFFIELLHVEQDNYNKFQHHFENIRKSICEFENNFNALLNNIKSDISKHNLNKINQLMQVMQEITKYKSSSEFYDKLRIETRKNRELPIKIQYYTIIAYKS